MALCVSLSVRIRASSSLDSTPALLQLSAVALGASAVHHTQSIVLLVIIMVPRVEGTLRGLQIGDHNLSSTHGSSHLSTRPS